jgi:hypothetical protein
MPTSVPVGSSANVLAVSDVQKALWVAHAQNPSIPDPGIVDNRWGTNTSHAYTAWASSVDSRILGNAPLGLTAPMHTRDTVVLLSPGAYSVLYSLSMVFRSEDAELQANTAASFPGAAPTPTGTGAAAAAHVAAVTGTHLAPPPASSVAWDPTPSPSGPSPTTWLLIGLGVGGVAIAGYLYFRKKPRGRRRR